MVARREGAGPAVVAFVAIIVVLAAGIAVASLVSQSPSSSSTKTTSTTGPTAQSDVNATSSSVLSPNGLELTLNLSSASLSQGSGVSIGVSLVNTLSTRNNLTASSSSEFTMGPCSQLPLGFAIFKGDYSSGNLSQGTPLSLNQPGVYNCPAMFEIAYWSFAPQGDTVTLVSPQPVSSGNATAPRDMTTETAGASLAYSGYYADQSNPMTSASLTSFSPGTYTLAASDAWGQLTLLHFSVT